jgi:hypothetical protein
LLLKPVFLLSLLHFFETDLSKSLFDRDFTQLYFIFDIPQEVTEVDAFFMLVLIDLDE